MLCKSTRRVYHAVLDPALYAAAPFTRVFKFTDMVPF